MSTDDEKTWEMVIPSLKYDEVGDQLKFFFTDSLDEFITTQDYPC